MEQRVETLDGSSHVAGGRRAETVAYVSSVDQCVQRWGRLIPKAGETECSASGRGRAKGAQFRGGTVVGSRVDVVGIGVQPGNAGVVDSYLVVGLGVSIGDGLRRHDPTETSVGVPSITRGLPTAVELCQETTASVEASAPNCRCTPVTGGHRYGRQRQQIRRSGRRPEKPAAEHSSARAKKR